MFRGLPYKAKYQGNHRLPFLLEILLISQKVLDTPILYLQLVYFVPSLKLLSSEKKTSSVLIPHQKL